MDVTICRIEPRKTNDKSSKYSFHRSLLHNYRHFNEDHIHPDVGYYADGCKTANECMDKAKSIINQFGLVKKNTTIDTCEMIFCVNSDYFKNNPERQTMFFEAAKSFGKILFKEGYLGCIAHADEHQYNVHLYAVPLENCYTKNKYEKTFIGNKVNYRARFDNDTHARKLGYTNAKDAKENDWQHNGQRNPPPTEQLQDDWWAHVTKYLPELQRGQRNSQAKHKSPRDYRRQVTDEMRETIEKQKKEIEKMAKDLAMAREANDDRWADIRRISLPEFYKLTGLEPTEYVTHKGKRVQIKIPIDHLMFVEKMNKEQIINFICHAFNAKIAGNLLLMYHKDNGHKPNYELGEVPKMYIDIKSMIRQQFEALGIKSARLSAKDINNKDTQPKTINLHKGQEVITLDDLTDIKMLRHMAYLNATGYNIFLTVEDSVDDNPSLLLIDNFKIDYLTKIVDEYGIPNMIIETSKENYQLLYNMAQDISTDDIRKTDDAKRIKLLNLQDEYNNLYVDPKCCGRISDWMLAGYRNREPGKDGHMVRVVAATQEQAGKIIEAWERQADTNQLMEMAATVDPDAFEYHQWATEYQSQTPINDDPSEGPQMR